MSLSTTMHVTNHAVKSFTDNELIILSKMSALDQFMLDDSRDWFYFSEITIDNAYQSMKKGIDLLVLDHDIKDSLKQLMMLNNCMFTDLSILIILYPLLVRSEDNTTLVQSCLSHLITKKIVTNPVISMSELTKDTLDAELETYRLLPHMKALSELILEIKIDLDKSQKLIC